MEKKIGVLTFWGVPNYGAFAQAYALNVVLNMIQQEHQVVHIGYLHPEHYKLYFQKKRPYKRRKADWINVKYYIRWLKYLINNKMEYPAFERDWNTIPHVAVSTQKELEQTNWDIVFTGSDAIWEYSIKEFGDDEHLIGNNLQCAKLFSYAASFGDMDEDSAFPEFVKKGLLKYDKLSVRDLSSSNIIKKLTGRDAEIVLDPTLLWDFSKDPQVPVTKYDNYIFVYGNHFPEEMIQEVKEYATSNQLQIIGGGLAPEWCDLRLTDIGPLEWIGMFAKAEFVVTCTFHGLMFSINFNKKVLFNQISYTVNRSATLLQELGLTELFQGHVTLREVLDYSWNYTEINHNLDVLRERSLAFLKGALYAE